MKKKPSRPSKAKGGSQAPGKYVSHSYKLPDADVHVIVPKDISKYYGDPASPELKSYDQVFTRLGEHVNWLYARAIMGESNAVNYLVEMGTAIANFLEHIHKTQSEFIENLAKRHLEWPTTITSNPIRLSQIRKQEKQLQLGHDILIRRDKTQFRKKDKLQREVIYHCLVILRSQPFVVKSIQTIKSYQNLIDKIGQEAPTSGFVVYLKGDLGKHQQQMEMVGRESKRSKHELAALLKLTNSVQRASPEILKVLQKACGLSVLCEATMEEWLNVVMEFLDALCGEALEQLDVLRPLGLPRGDVKIRSMVDRVLTRDMPSLRVRFKDHEAVNGEIRYGIRLKMENALVHFIERK